MNTRLVYTLLGCFFSIGLFNGCSILDPETYKQDLLKSQVELNKNESLCYKNNDISDCISKAQEYHSYKEDNYLKKYESDYFSPAQRVAYLNANTVNFAGKACVLKDPKMCFVIGETLDHMKNADIDVHSIFRNLSGLTYQAETAFAKHSINKSCELNYPVACRTLARLKEKGSDNYAGIKQGYYIVEDLSKQDVVSLYKKACELDNSYCRDMARLYYYGIIVDTDMQQVNSYISKTCADTSDSNKKSTCEEVKEFYSDNIAKHNNSNHNNTYDSASSNICSNLTLRKVIAGTNNFESIQITNKNSMPISILKVNINRSGWANPLSQPKLAFGQRALLTHMADAVEIQVLTNKGVCVFSGN